MKIFTKENAKILFFNFAIYICAFCVFTVFIAILFTISPWSGYNDYPFYFYFFAALMNLITSLAEFLFPSRAGVQIGFLWFFPLTYIISVWLDKKFFKVTTKKALIYSLVSFFVMIGILFFLTMSFIYYKEAAEARLRMRVLGPWFLSIILN